MTTIITKIVIRIVLLIETYLSYLIKKDKKIWVYYPTHFRSVDGNVKALFDYVNANHKQIKQYILDSNFKSKNEKYSKYIVKRYSLKGILLSLKANVIFIDTGNEFSKGKFNVVQLWHGTGYKNIHSLKKNSSSKDENKYKNLILISASSEEDKIRKEKSFKSSNVYLTGSPKNDFLFEKDAAQLKDELRKKIGIEHFDKVYCYAPTFRDKGEFKPFSQGFYNKLQQFASKENITFVIKLHPSVSDFPIPSEYPNIINISKLIKDVHSIFLISDLLITDYSSVSSDYALLHKPIVFYTYDFDEYVSKSRDMYYDIKKILPGPFAYTDEELLRIIEDLTWFNSEQYQEQYSRYLNLFHYYKDNKSSERIYQLVNRLLEKK
jgi:CDP-glycerol glycerophosphotransferase